jgi:Conjugative transposon, TraM
MIGFDQSLATQVAGAGLDAAKSLLNKKVRRIKVKLKAGYPILLRDNKLNP